MPDKEYLGFAPHLVDDTEEVEHLEATRKRLNDVPEYVRKWTRIQRVATQGRSELAHDDGATDWLRVTQAIDYAMMVAADALHALARLYADDSPSPLPLSAHYALTRSGLEAASLAL